MSEAASARSVAERYLKLSEGDFESHASYPRVILAPAALDPSPLPYADLKTPTPPPPKEVPTMQQARRELRANAQLNTHELAFSVAKARLRGRCGGREAADSSEAFCVPRLTSQTRRPAALLQAPERSRD